VDISSDSYSSRGAPDSSRVPRLEDNIKRLQDENRKLKQANSKLEDDLDNLRRQPGSQLFTQVPTQASTQAPGNQCCTKVITLTS
jgi:hypothetical protein